MHEDRKRFRHSNDAVSMGAGHDLLLDSYICKEEHMTVMQQSKVASDVGLRGSELIPRLGTCLMPWLAFGTCGADLRAPHMGLTQLKVNVIRIKLWGDAYGVMLGHCEEIGEEEGGCQRVGSW